MLNPPGISGHVQVSTESEYCIYATDPIQFGMSVFATLEDVTDKQFRWND